MALRLGHGVPEQSPVATILRLTWTFAGHAVGLFAAAEIVIAGRRGPMVADLVLWLAAVAVVGARWFEVTRYGGPDLGGEAVSTDQFWRFTALVAIGAALVWGAAHALGWALSR